ncbi:hypothetical protein B0H16DRAFT_1479698 [Mycena metata]|uniref:Uncharacterized protein n=1 Tax=Mycena metata TaxID=1033252 RepID=A0AAD7MDE7_9AGAR|nr:hypothetical protein B0H16DRAFT_1479698 [Mycena metata]
MPRVKSTMNAAKQRLLQRHMLNYLDARARGYRSVRAFLEWICGYYFHRFGVTSLRSASVPADTDSTVAFSVEEMEARAALAGSVTQSELELILSALSKSRLGIHSSHSLQAKIESSGGRHGRDGHPERNMEDGCSKIY